MPEKIVKIAWTNKNLAMFALGLCVIILNPESLISIKTSKGNPGGLRSHFSG